MFGWLENVIDVMCVVMCFDILDYIGICVVGGLCECVWWVWMCDWSVVLWCLVGVIGSGGWLVGDMELVVSWLLVGCIEYVWVVLYVDFFILFFDDCDVDGVVVDVLVG